MKVQLFITCLTEQFFPTTLENMVHILKKQKVMVDFPDDQTCCGQPLFNSGFQSEARKLAKNWVEVFSAQEGYIVSPSGSCVDMIRHHYPTLFPKGTDEHEIVSDLVSRTFEFCEFLVKVLNLTQLGSHFPHAVTYHASCHLSRGLGLKDEAKILLNEVQDIDIRQLPEEDVCCGFGGVFSVVYPDVSKVMMERKIANIEGTGAEYVTACDAGCLMNIGGGLKKINSRIKPRHIIDILASTG